MTKKNGMTEIEKLTARVSRKEKKLEKRKNKLTELEASQAKAEIIEDQKEKIAQTELNINKLKKKIEELGKTE